MIKIAITNEKGGTGKSTIACLLVEYLNHLKKKVQLTDTDPIQTSQTWASNCQQEGRQVSTTSANYQIIDTAGSSGSALAWLAEADLILVPFRPHYSDWQAKIIFIPNHWQNTKEQRQGLDHLKEVIKEEKQGKITHPLTNRPALYGILLNGSKINFFSRKGLPSEVKELFKQILTNHEKTN